MLTLFLNAGLSEIWMCFEEENESEMCLRGKSLRKWSLSLTTNTKNCLKTTFKLHIDIKEQADQAPEGG